jgi:nicotinamide-nucleotide amidase
VAAQPEAGVTSADSTVIIAELTARGLTLAVAESLTGGLLTAEFVRPAGASLVLLGGVVAYSTELKHSLLGVDAALLAEHGAVHAEVARQMATRVREKLAVAGRPADIGISTTGVAGPDSQDGQPVGTVYLGLAIGDAVCTTRLDLSGDRAAIRSATVGHALDMLAEHLGIQG